MKLASIILNGVSLPKELELGEYIVCADGGYDLLIARDIKPDMLLGDLDSISSLDDIDIPTMKYNTHKNYTDGELAIRHVIELGYSDVNIYGAFGGRPDHVIGNLTLMNIALEENVNAICIDEDVRACMSKGITTLQSKIGSIISIVPFSDMVHIIDSKGLEYPLDDLIINNNSTVGISNVASSDVISLNIVEGIALIFIFA